MTHTSVHNAFGTFPETRLRRTRMQGWCRDMVAEHHLHPSDLILPVFIQEGSNSETPVASMPGVLAHHIGFAGQKGKVS
jgi:porphobilinogen synthase